jgi:hypothetical protein
MHRCKLEEPLTVIFMSLEEKRRLILALDNIIRSKIPGKAEHLAKRLGVSRSTFFRLIDYMREELYAAVFFDNRLNRYAYEKEGIIMFRFLPADLIDVEQAKKIVGGNKLKTKFDKVFLSVSTVETL